MPFVTLDATVSFPTAWSGGFTVERHDSLMSAPVRFFVPFRDDERRVLGSSRCRDVACRGSHGHGDRMQ